MGHPDLVCGCYAVVAAKAHCQSLALADLKHISVQRLVLVACFVRKHGSAMLPHAENLSSPLVKAVTILGS